MNFCSRNAPQHGVQSRAISRAILWHEVCQCGKVTHSLRHVVFWKQFFEHFQIFATSWYALLHPIRIATPPHAHCHEFFPHCHANCVLRHKPLVVPVSGLL